MSKRIAPIMASLSLALMAGCASNQPVETVPIDAVLDALKTEIGKIKPTAELPPDTANVCADPDHVVRVTAYPTKAVVDLKTVLTVAVDANGTASIPVGPSGIVVGPSVSGSSSRANTKDVILTLPVQHTPPTRADLQTEIAALQKYIADRTKIQGALKAGQDTDSKQAAQEFNAPIAAAKQKLHDDDIQLAALEASIPDQTPFLIHPFSLVQPVAPVLPAQAGQGDRSDRPSIPVPVRPAGRLDFELPISEAFNRVIIGMLSTSHTRPCFLPQQMDIKVNFEAIKKGGAGATIAFLVAKVGGDVSRTDDTTQSVTVTFDLSNGNAAVSGSSPTPTAPGG